jgi:hypothetical protein
MAVKQDKLTIYEFRVPLAAREIHPAGIASEPGKNIKVGFEWGGMTAEMRKAMASGIGAEGARAGAMDSGFADTGEDTGKAINEDEGMSAGGSGSSLARMRMGPKKYSFWVDVKLAQHQ